MTACLLYQQAGEKSRLFRQFQDFCHFIHDLCVVFPAVRLQALGAILDAVIRIKKVASAAVAQGIEGAVAEQTVEVFRVRAGMTGEVFTLLILEKIVMAHFIPPSRGK
jgi:hypothetical protein